MATNIEKNPFLVHDFNDPKLNDAFRRLDEKNQDDILRYKKEIQIEILRKIVDPKYNDKYNSLTDKQKSAVDKMKIRDK